MCQTEYFGQYCRFLDEVSTLTMCIKIETAFALLGRRRCRQLFATKRNHLYALYPQFHSVQRKLLDIRKLGVRARIMCVGGRRIPSPSLHDCAEPLLLLFILRSFKCHLWVLNLRNYSLCGFLLGRGDDTGNIVPPVTGGKIVF